MSSLPSFSHEYCYVHFTKGHSCLSISESLDAANWLVTFLSSYSISYLVCHAFAVSINFLGLFVLFKLI